MEKDSGIFTDNDSFLEGKGKDKPFLLKSTSHSTLYRIIHDGKFFLFKTSSHPAEREKSMIRREYELSIGCDHPHIAHVFLYEKSSPLGEGILMEYIEGRTLNEFLAENPSCKSRERIIGELLEAVGYLHKKGIVHNDLKPENILISRNGDSLKLIDFGLSDDDAHFMVKTPGCSPAYAAPELKEDRKSDVRSDIYSLGKIMRSIAGNRHKGISSKCIRENPDKRFQNIDSLSKAWKNRNRLRNILFAGVPLLLILFLIPLFLLEIRSRNEKMEESLVLQNEVIENQRDEFNKMQSAYASIKDSLKDVNRQAELFERLKKERIETFKREYDNRFKQVYDSMLRCKTTTEIAELSSDFFNEAQSYYNEFDKTVEGKDISPELYTVFLEKRDQSNEKIQKAILKTL